MTIHHHPSYKGSNFVVFVCVYGIRKGAIVNMRSFFSGIDLLGVELKLLSFQNISISSA
jgi:hypothetical protein